MSDLQYFISWWFTIFALGLTFLPLSYLIFKRFWDCGWIFSKAVGIGITSWLVWFLSSCHILKFTTGGIWVVLVLSLAANAALLVYLIRNKKFSISMSNILNMLITEAVFTAVFAFWIYLKCFKPEAYGTTEKLMDFGFMQAMFKSEYMPPEDMWLSGHDLNYYYVGQFIATYLSKLSGVGVEYGYNLMLMMVAAFAFSMPASIVANACRDMFADEKKKGSFAEQIFPVFTGGLAGLAVCFTGNMHYVIYARLIPWIRTMLGLDKMAESSGYSFPGYWFPNATRYIGYNPETNDKTIHEFPLYSFVLGDLHAHVINIMFVLTVVAILYAYLQYRREKMNNARSNCIYADSGNTSGHTIWGIPDCIEEVFNPPVVLTGFFIGLFHTTNFWDFPIYFVVAGAVILLSNAVIYNFSLTTLKLTLFHAIVVFVTAKLVCLPFTLKFHQISTSVMLCENHTPLYQLIILWGLPVLCLLVFIVATVRNQIQDGVYVLGENRAEAKSKPGRDIALFRFIANMNISDLFIVIIGLCALGLVLIPEVIYVKDIYSGDYKRANTMFKLTYQSYILFGMTMSYAVSKMLFYTRKKGRRIFALIMLVFLIMTTGYFNNSTKAWFGDWKDSENYKGLNAGEYLKDVNADDYYAANWINDNIEGRPVMLEVNGDSYTDYCRISVRTGLPTLLGWRTHEWLWQSDETGGLPEIVSKRGQDIETIYTSHDVNTVKQMVGEYDIEYIYIGKLEREKYEAGVNHMLLQSLGKVVYPAGFDPDDSYDTTYIIKVDR
ncbi:MAG: hypothetical protein K6G81_06440 [Lachnospiraceae bacterium]|nr:hypothetical protein [Lachnospiraceae bacterium]